MSDSKIETLQNAGRLRPLEVNAAVAQIWRDLHDDPEFVAAFGDLENPYEARPDGAEADICTAIAIAVISGLAKEAATALWKEYIWPKLKAQYGAGLKPIRDDHAY